MVTVRASHPCDMEHLTIIDNFTQRSTADLPSGLHCWTHNCAQQYCWGMSDSGTLWWEEMGVKEMGQLWGSSHSWGEMGGYYCHWRQGPSVEEMWPVNKSLVEFSQVMRLPESGDTSKRVAGQFGTGQFGKQLITVSLSFFCSSPAYLQQSIQIWLDLLNIHTLVFSWLGNN